MGTCQICQFQKESEIKTNNSENILALESNSELNLIKGEKLSRIQELKDGIKKLINNSSNDKKNQNQIIPNQKDSYNTGYNYQDQRSDNINITNVNAPQIPLDLVIKAKKSICKINIKSKKGNKTVIGFFMKIRNYNYYLIVNDHIIYEDIPNGEIELELYNHKKIKTKFNENIIKYCPISEITIVKIEKNEYIFNDIIFLFTDIYLNDILKSFKKKFIFSIKDPFGESTMYSIGQIVHYDDDLIEFCHNLTIDRDLTGSPIMILNNNIIEVIGIHKESGTSKGINIGVLIKKIINSDLKVELEPDDINYCRNNNYKKFDGLVVNFISDDLSINYRCICLRNDNFSRLEEKLYQDYPELSYKNIYFVVRGNLINRSLTIKENKINNGDIIIIMEIK